MSAPSLLMKGATMAKKKKKKGKTKTMDPCQIRNLNMTGAVRTPPKHSVAKLSILQHGKNNYALQIHQDRGFAEERRLVDLADVGVVCKMRNPFKKEVDNIKSPVANEDWDEWSKFESKQYCGKDEILKAFENSKKPGVYDRTMYGTAFVKPKANVLIEAQFGLPASLSTEWASPLPPPESVALASICC